MHSLERCCAAHQRADHSPSSSSGSRLEAELFALDPAAAAALLLHWAPQSRPFQAEQLARARPLVAALLPALRRGAVEFGRQQLADVAWGLSHFDALRFSALHGASAAAVARYGQHVDDQQQQQQQQQQQEEEQVQQQQQHGDHWSAEFCEAMQVPFRVLPCALQDLRLPDFLEELGPALRRDVIYLDGGARAVEVRGL
jgi:hypothetical protein